MGVGYGCGKIPMDQGSGTSGLFPTFKVERPKPVDAKTERVSVDLTETMRRWNIAAEGYKVPNGVGGSFDFIWEEQDYFPHPTYKGGSDIAYMYFQDIFMKLFDNQENLDYVKANNIQSEELIHRIGDSVGIRTSFRELDDTYSTGYFD
jgi:hypothetical protein